MTGKATIDLDRFIHAEFTKRARQALILYRKYPRRTNAPGYPFEKRPERDGSTRNPANAKVIPIPGGVRITVTSRGAPFFEAGNRGASGRKQFISGDPELALPLKRGAAKSMRKGKRGKRAKVIIGNDGRPYLMVQRVRTYKGERALEKSARAAFGIKGRITRLT